MLESQSILAHLFNFVFIHCAKLVPKKSMMKSSIETRVWDIAEHLETEEDMTAYLDAALEGGDPAFIVAALGDIARAKGMSQIALDAGLGRESLYKALSPSGNPEFATILKVVTALGLKFHVQPAQA